MKTNNSNEQFEAPTVAGSMRLFGGWLVRWDYDREGYWITDAAGYRNTLKAAYTRITDTSGQVARRIVLWRFMLEWGKPSNIPS